MKSNYYTLLSGIPRGARIAVVLENSYTLAEVIRYCFENDLVVVPIDPKLPKEKRDFVVSHSEAYAVIDENGLTIRQVNPQEYEGNFLIIYTSGSTGDPKGVILSKQSVIENAQAVGKLHGFDKGRKHATCLPLYHCNALCMSLIGTLIYKQSFFLLEKFTVQGYMNLIEENQIITASIVPALLEKLVYEKPKLPECLDYFITAAAPLSSSLAKRFYDLYGPKLVQGYGLSEAVNFSFVMPKLDANNFVENYISSHPPVGLPVGETRVKFDDGEVLVSGKNLMKGYLKNEEATENALTDDGFLRTGDLGIFRGQYLVLNGRKKEVINRGGEIIYPKDVEEDWVNFHFDNPPVAFSVQNNLLSDEIGMWVDSHYKDIVSGVSKAHYKPVVVQTGQTIRTSVGKPQRKKMGELFISRNIEQNQYRLISNQCRRIAEKILSLPAPTKKESRAEYIYRQAEAFYSRSKKYDDIDVELSDAISQSLEVFEENIGEILADNMTGEQLMKLYPGLWRRLMNESPMGEYAHLCAAFLLKGNRLGGKVVELGSGIGNTSDLIKDSINDEYVRSDIGKDLNSRFPRGEYASIDFNKPLPVQGVNTIFATNALHCAKDKKQTLEYIFNSLEVGGSLIIAEGEAFTHENTPWALNMFYGLFDGWWNISGFLSRRDWLDLFEKAGFEDIGWSILWSGHHDLGGLIWGKKPN